MTDRELSYMSSKNDACEGQNRPKHRHRLSGRRRLGRYSTSASKNVRCRRAEKGHADSGQHTPILPLFSAYSLFSEIVGNLKT